MLSVHYAFMCHLNILLGSSMGFRDGSVLKNPLANAEDLFYPLSRDLWEGNGISTAVFLPVETYWQSLVGYSP